MEYKRLQEALYQKVGDEGWLLQHQSDYRTRLVHFERLKREGYRSYLEATDSNWGWEPWWHQYSPQSPWNLVVDAANRDRDWWWDELHPPAVWFSKRWYASSGGHQ